MITQNAITRKGNQCFFTIATLVSFVKVWKRATLALEGLCGCFSERTAITVIGRLRMTIDEDLFEF
jgi:hypothetical protein